MKKGTKFGLGIAAALIGVVALTSCTQSFCSPTDSARIMYAFEPGITEYSAGTDSVTFYKTNFETMETSTEVLFTLNNTKEDVATWDANKDGFVFENGRRITYLSDMVNKIKGEGEFAVTENTYYKELDKIVLTRILTVVASDSFNSLDLSDEKDMAQFNRIVSVYSHLKFIESDNGTMWSNFNKFDNYVRTKIGDPNLCPGSDFVTYYKTTLNGYASAYRTCLTTKEDKYGSYGYDASGVFINAKSWGYAWSKGFFEGLLVYPIGWLIDQVVGGFRSAGATAGVSAFLGIIVVTFIIRSLMLLATFKQTTGNAKMTELQPEIQKIQNKYPNSNTSRVEKQRMAEEMQRLYKKNKINPFTSLLVMIVQFPVFICVWGALSGSAAITNGSILGLNLSLGIKDVLFVKANWTLAGGYSAVTALFLFLFMAGAQTVSMLLPQWIQKARAKKVAKLGKNPAQQSQSKQMKIFTYVMLALIIFMGFSLVSAMGIYWLIGAIFSIVQTIITQSIMAKKAKKK